MVYSWPVSVLCMGRDFDWRGSNWRSGLGGHGTFNFQRSLHSGGVWRWGKATKSKYAMNIADLMRWRWYVKRRMESMFWLMWWMCSERWMSKGLRSPDVWTGYAWTGH